MPEGLIDATQYFGDENSATNFCLRCAGLMALSVPVAARKTSARYVSLAVDLELQGLQETISVKVGTIFEDSPLSLTKWLPATWLIVNAKNGISSCELQRALGVTQKTAWFMLHRIRLAMQNMPFSSLTGHVEADETYIGAKARYMHKHRRTRRRRCRNQENCRARHP